MRAKKISVSPTQYRIAAANRSWIRALIFLLEGRVILRPKRRGDDARTHRKSLYQNMNNRYSASAAPPQWLRGRLASQSTSSQPRLSHIRHYYVSAQDLGTNKAAPCYTERPTPQTLPAFSQCSFLLLLSFKIECRIKQGFPVSLAAVISRYATISAKPYSNDFIRYSL